MTNAALIRLCTGLEAAHIVDALLGPNPTALTREGTGTSSEEVRP